MNISINPLSGHDNSYYDINFNIILDNKNSRISILNTTNNSLLEILSTDSGQIKNETFIYADSQYISGYFNLFNKDKLNKMFANYIKITLKFIIEDLDSNTTHEELIDFYNESKSADSDIMPFDIILKKNNINVTTEDLQFVISCNTENKFELCIQDSSQINKCTFEVIAKKGKTEVLIPGNVLFSDLLLNKSSDTFNMYWVRYEGYDYNKFQNRKYLKINKLNISLSHSQDLIPQNRNGPLGELDKDFILSDKYFVHTHKDFSAFAAKEINNVRMKKMSVFFLESFPMVKDNVNTKVKTVKNNNIIMPKDNFFQAVLSSKKDSVNINQAQKVGCSSCSRKK